MKIWSLYRISYFMIYTLCKTFHLFETIHHLRRFNPLWPSDSIWQHRFGSTLVQVMACCLMAPSHYLNQCWPVINKVFWHSPHCNFTGNALNINNWCELEYYQFKKHNHTFLWTMSFYRTLAKICISNAGTHGHTNHFSQSGQSRSGSWPITQCPIAQTWESARRQCAGIVIVEDKSPAFQTVSRGWSGCICISSVG